uniref:Uncharacterized protein n=1 Tax=Oryza meridionalis TaxID=40149 RepID=A0A0E0DNB5_9ORYZ
GVIVPKKKKEEKSWCGAGCRGYFSPSIPTSSSTPRELARRLRVPIHPGERAGAPSFVQLLLRPHPSCSFQEKC